MAGVKISALPLIVTPAATDIFATVQAGVTYQVNGTQMGTLFLPITGGTLTGNLILNGNPTAANQAANKAYVDATAQGITVQAACRLGTTGALTVTYANGASGVGATLTNAGAFVALSLDGTLTVVGDRVLIKNQAATLQNGIYTVTTVGDGVSVNWVLTRATDYDQVAEIQPGDLVLITAGATLTNSGWLETATVTTIGTNPIVFAQFSASLPISVPNGGTGLTSTTINQILYSSAANTIAGLASANSGVLVTSAGGVPSISSTLPAFTTSSITFNPTTGGILGTTTNDSAAVGYVGEYITSNVPVASALVVATGVVTDITSISLTAGDWDVYGNILIIESAGMTNTAGWVSSTSATQPDFSKIATLVMTSATIGYMGMVCPMLRVSIAGTTPVYLSGVESTRTPVLMCGTISARRVR